MIFTGIEDLSRMNKVSDDVGNLSCCVLVSDGVFSLYVELNIGSCK